MALMGWGSAGAGNLVTVTRKLFIRDDSETGGSTSQRRSLAEAATADSSEILQEILMSAAVNRSVPNRHVTPENQLVSGFLIHQTRKPSYSLCNRFFASKLAHACLLQQLAGPLSAGSFRRSATDPFGTDPVFNSLSSMYDSQTSQNVWQYYNASASAGEVAPTGTPYGFFSRAISGFPDGFPVVFPVYASAGAVQRVLQMLSEGAFIDVRTAGMSGLMVTYNAAAEAFAIANFVLARGLHGTFTIDAVVTASSAAWYRMNTPTGFLRLLSDVFVLCTGIWHVLTAWLSTRRRAALLKRVEKHPEIAEDASVAQALEFPNLVVVLACFHAISICVFIVRLWFNFMLPDKIDAQHQVYHNLESAAARILMPFKKDSYAALSADIASVDEFDAADAIPECVGIGSTTGSGSGDSLADGGVLSELPAWALSDDESGLNNMIRELTLVARTAQLKVVYVSLQSVLVILTLARWMAIADAVPRVGTIVRTLRKATTAFAELSLVFLMLGLPIGISLVMTVGARVEAFSSPHKMLQQLGEESIACAPVTHKTAAVGC
eukprot:jgi/Ulvmu1/12382/UM009_0028.1